MTVVIVVEGLLLALRNTRVASETGYFDDEELGLNLMRMAADFGVGVLLGLPGQGRRRLVPSNSACSGP